MSATNDTSPSTVDTLVDYIEAFNVVVLAGATCVVTITYVIRRLMKYIYRVSQTEMTVFGDAAAHGDECADTNDGDCDRGIPTPSKHPLLQALKNIHALGHSSDSDSLH